MALKKGRRKDLVGKKESSPIGTEEGYSAGTVWETPAYFDKCNLSDGIRGRGGRTSYSKPLKRGERRGESTVGSGHRAQSCIWAPKKKEGAISGLIFDSWKRGSQHQKREKDIYT